MNHETLEKRFVAVSRSATFRRIVDRFELSHKRVLDLGCGYGEYLTHFEKGSLGITTSQEEVRAGKERSLDIRFGNAEFLEEISLPDVTEAVWANNLFEHLLSPHAFLMKLKKNVAPGGLLILGVPVVPRVSALVLLSRFRGSLASNHINFFTKETLALTVKRAGWEVSEVRPYWFSPAWLDCAFSWVAPHLYVVAKNNPGFKYPDKKYNEWIADSHYKDLFEITDQND